MLRHEPGSSPVTFAERPTAVPETGWLPREGITLTLRGASGAVVLHTEVNCS